MTINAFEVDASMVGGGKPPTTRPPTNCTAVIDDMILNGCEVDAGIVPWHPVVEAVALFPAGFIATRFAKAGAFLWPALDGPTGQCLQVPCVPDDVRVPDVPDVFAAPPGGKPC